jgi:putative component of toxin-antitoxin plasmid stabilization module
MRLEVVFHDKREFEKWLASIGLDRALRVGLALERTAHFGGSWYGMPVVRYLGERLYEIRVGGDRVYFSQQGGAMTVLTAGSKDSQRLDIRRARRRLA